MGVAWTSSDTSVATIDNTGLLSTVGALVDVVIEADANSTERKNEDN